MAVNPLRRTWGEATALFYRKRRFGAVDLLVVIGFVGLAFALFSVARQWTGQLRPTVEIDRSPWALPRYTLYSLSRGLFAYVLSFFFTLAYGYWAAKDAVAERVLVPLLDILQSIPVLGFMPGLVLALVALFPSSNTGLEMAAVIMIFTGQAWNMTFSLYHSLKSIPLDQREVATAYQFSAWQRLKWVELPASTMGLVWNSMMSMAGGWFFLMISEAFVLGKKDFRLPGLGSYMSVAVAKGDVPAMIWAILSMILMIVLVDQLLWRPIVVWAQKFRIEESGVEGEKPTSWFLGLLQLSGLLRAARHGLEKLSERSARPQIREQPVRPSSLGKLGVWIGRLCFIVLMLALLTGSIHLLRLLEHVSLGAWGAVLGSAGATLARVLAATLIGTLWALPAGLAIGLSPRLSRILQPVVQIVASFPAPMLFPAVVALLSALGVSLNWGSVLLMLLGTQWYILFNVIAGAMAIPADLREAATSYRITGWRRFKILYMPAVFPYLVTGWVTAAGGAWNASIVAEFLTFRGKTLTAWGIGAQISRAAEDANFPALAAGIGVLALVVVIFNRLVWKKLYRLAADRYALSK